MREPGREQLADRFYSARDLRTVEYLHENASTAALEAPVTLVIDTSVASTRAGQAAARALVDMLVRVHRQVRIEAPEAPLIGDGAETLRTQLWSNALAIDPFQEPDRSRQGNELTVAVTATGSRRNGCDVLVTWQGGRGEVHVRGASPPDPIAISGGSIPELSEPNWTGHLLGAATAACLGAAAVFRLTHADTPLPTAVNLLERTEGALASTATLTGPVDVGRVMAVGAGAVGHALSFWCRELGSVGAWEFVDKDHSELHNSNRCMGMTAQSAGWPDGVKTGLPMSKAHSAADAMGARAVEAWFHELPADRGGRDLVLVLANEHGVRASVASLGAPLLVHATTSSWWTAELHRHRAGVDDDCPACRIPVTQRPATFACSTGPAAPSEPQSGDAALPFLSACAGLMLTVALLDLTADQTIFDTRHNHWRCALELNGYVWQRIRQTSDGCPHTLAAPVRRRVSQLAPGRWDGLDLEQPSNAARNATPSE